jgi:vacuolar-type H+-ATPase subunit E/Vma4
MTQQELEAALRRDGENEAAEIWRKAEAEAEQLRQTTDQEIDRQRRRLAARRQVEITERRAEVLTAARRTAQNCRLRAEDALARRLHRLATGMLDKLALAGDKQLFRALSAEIPDYPWQLIKVRHSDQTLAHRSFPDAKIEVAAGISAGLEVQSADRRICIINTLECRFEHLWPELLPELFSELRQMAGDDETTT